MYFPALESVIGLGTYFDHRLLVNMIRTGVGNRLEHLGNCWAKEEKRYGAYLNVIWSIEHNPALTSTDHTCFSQHRTHEQELNTYFISFFKDAYFKLLGFMAIDCIAFLWNYPTDAKRCLEYCQERMQTIARVYANETVHKYSPEGWWGLWRSKHLSSVPELIWVTRPHTCVII